jgi:hypothetical protein
MAVVSGIALERTWDACAELCYSELCYSLYIPSRGSVDHCCGTDERLERFAPGPLIDAYYGWVLYLLWMIHVVCRLEYDLAYEL